MQRISFAPVLSATRSRDSCWITSHSVSVALRATSNCLVALRAAVNWFRPTSSLRSHRPGPLRGRTGGPRADRPRYLPSRGRHRAPPLLGLLQDLDQPPPLGGRQRPGLHDLHPVADARDPLLVVRLELARAPDDLAVQAVLHAVLDLDDDRLVHLVADDEALSDLAVAATGQAGP